jgi:predicted Zn-dependent protease
MSVESDTAAHVRALLLDPFIHEGRVLLFAPPPRPLFSTASNRAWEAFWAGNYRVAADAFRQHLRGHGGDLPAQWASAISLYYLSAFDESAARLRTLEDTLRRRHDAHFSREYESLHLLAYMQAVAYAAAGRRDSARAAAERALGENLAFYQARMLLGDLALASGDTAAASREWSDARDVFADDAVAHRRYADFLMRTGQPADAERELRAALRSEPDWADAYGALAQAIDAQGAARREDAARAYEEFLRRAPAEPAEARQSASARLAALRAP